MKGVETMPNPHGRPLVDNPKNKVIRIKVTQDLQRKAVNYCHKNKTNLSKLLREYLEKLLLNE
ncbi:MAG: hypothetical protein VB122_05685 [Erysipelotrichales bacterium]|nr:hypothetical protein [Erysipelotrichales bacterium]